MKKYVAAAFVDIHQRKYSAAIFDRDSIPLLFHTASSFSSLSLSLSPLSLSLSVSLCLSLLCRYLDTCSFSRSYSSSRSITTVAVTVDAQHRSESTLSSLHFLFLLSLFAVSPTTRFICHCAIHFIRLCFFFITFSRIQIFQLRR